MNSEIETNYSERMTSAKRSEQPANESEEEPAQPKQMLTQNQRGQ